MAPQMTVKSGGIRDIASTEGMSRSNKAEDRCDQQKRTQTNRKETGSRHGGRTIERFRLKRPCSWDSVLEVSFLILCEKDFHRLL